jgi:zinc/manganese transport system permease protein
VARAPRRFPRRALARAARAAGALARHRVHRPRGRAGRGARRHHRARHGLEIAGWTTQITAVCSALLASLLLTWTERKRPEAQEALIGVLFVLASTAQILLLANDPHGGEDLKDLLAGQILWVSSEQLIRAAILTAIFLVAWFRWRERFGRVGFYVLFALMVTVSVQLAGVYLVFTSLIVPALATYRYPQRRQLVIGYTLAFASYALGLWASAVVDLPSSAVIVWVMALVGLIVHVANRNGPVAAAANGHRAR